MNSSSRSLMSSASTTVSGPFNVQHIPKVMNIGGVTNDLVIDTQSNNVTNATPKKFSVNTLVVCTYPFRAEYDNELSCAPGDVLKLVDPKITNGWVLSQSLSSGIKGWVPHDNVKILDLFNSKPELGFTTGNESTKDNNTLSTVETASSSLTTSTTNSLLDYYSLPVINTSSDSSADRSTDFTSASCSFSTSSSHSFTTIPYSSIFVHSMYSDEGSTFWYRIDLVSSIDTNQKIHIRRYYNDFQKLSKRLTSCATVSDINIKLPTLLPPFTSNREIYSTDALSESLSNVNSYLQNLFELLKFKTYSPLIENFLSFFKMTKNDFEHYAFLNDDQIMNILKPKNNNTLSNTKLGNNFTANISRNDLQEPSFTFAAPRMQKSTSTNSINSKTSSNATIDSSSTSSCTTHVKIKIIWKDEFSIIKMNNDELSFNNLSSAISLKLGGLRSFTIAFRNNNGVFVLLKDDDGLRRAVVGNSKKLLIKVIQT